MFYSIFQNFQHENISRRLVESIMHEESVKEAFKAYLGDGQEYEENITFIQDLIHSKKFVSFLKILKFNISLPAQTPRSNQE